MDATNVLLLGGTSETAPLAMKLATAGYAVLVSTATDAVLAIGDHPAIRRRCGRLNGEQLAALIREQDIVALVDATHPYASEVHQLARRVAGQTMRPYLRYQRRPLLAAQPGWIEATDHAEAAQIACSGGNPILLTTGSRHLAPYVAEAHHCRLPLFARILDHPESIAACDTAGLDETGRIFGRGPFSLEQNRALIRRHQIGVVVTKDSGNAGGVLEKLEATQLEHCLLIVVQRPQETETNCFDDMDKLVDTLLQQYPRLTD
ncbi:MAG: precorrin-6A reductase [Desulfuromonas sp.]|nr:precorrin-6A reductase [Desulfuromonas sp.]